MLFFSSVFNKARLSSYRRGTCRKHIVARSGFLKIWSCLQKQYSYFFLLLLLTQCKQGTATKKNSSKLQSEKHSTHNNCRSVTVCWWLTSVNISLNGTLTYFLFIHTHANMHSGCKSYWKWRIKVQQKSCLTVKNKNKLQERLSTTRVCH